MNVIQSYLATIMHGSFSKYEVRIFLKIVERAQERINEAGGPEVNLGASIPAVGISRRFSVLIRDLFPEEVPHYALVRDCVTSLMSKIVKHYDSDKKQWRAASLISEVLIDSAKGYVSFAVSDWVMSLILDFSKSFSSYDMEVAMRCNSPYTARFYMLVNSMKQPLDFKVETLRGIMGCDDKYPRTYDFIKRVIEPAEKELEKLKVNGFRHKLKKNGAGVTAEIKIIQLIPVKRGDEKAIVARAPLGVWCPGWLKDIMTMELGFSAKELGANKATLFQFSKLESAVNRLDIIIRRTRIKRKGHGYIINAMKSEIAASKK